MTGLLELVERCEKATGPDRELDLAIYLTLWPKSDLAKMTKYRRGLDNEDGYSWEIVQGSVCFHRMDDGGCPFNGGYPLPAFTASIDAAMTLLPPNRSVIQYWIVGKKPSVSIQGIDETERDTHTNANTKELALCAAALRSRQSLVTGVV